MQLSLLYKFHPAVIGLAFGGIIIGDGFCFAIAFCGESGSVCTHFYQLGFYGIGTLLRKLEIIGIIAIAVCMAANFEMNGGVFGKKLLNHAQDGDTLRFQRGFVYIKLDSPGDELSVV